MPILAIDTSGSACSVALYDAARDLVLCEITEDIGRGHAERLMAMIDEVIGKAGVTLQQIERIAVCVGPGSFTGIRTGVAAARGLGLALDRTVDGISTLSMIAHQEIAKGKSEPAREFSHHPIAAVIDAKRGEVYLQIFSPDGTVVTPAEVTGIDEARASIARHAARPIGTGAGLIDGADHGPYGMPPAALAAQLATRPETRRDPKPLYLRGPDAKPQDGFALERRA